MQQIGFIKGNSMVLQLLNVVDSRTNALDRGKSIIVMYLNFMKAFDTVPHKDKIDKLKSYGMDYYTLRWIQASLSDCVQQVSVFGTKTSKCYKWNSAGQCLRTDPICFIYK